MSYNYNQWVTNLGNLLVIPTGDPNFQTMLPNAIDYAEQRLYRDLDILNTIVRDQGGALTANSRNFTLPQTYGRFVVLESLNVFNTVGVTSSGRQPLTPVTREYLDSVWPNETAPSTPSVPDRYAMITDQQIIVGPAPDAAYTMEAIGTIRPTPLSASNPTTYLTLYLPDLFFTATLIFGYAYMKDFGAMTDDPNSAATWEAQYKLELASANVEEQRKRYASMAWTPKQPTPIATPARV